MLIDGDESKWESVSPLIDGQSYVEASTEYERKTGQLLDGSGTIILAGDGVRINVRNRALNLYHGRTHVPQEEVTDVLWAGTHNIRRVIILSDDGYITFEAVDWCRKQNIDILMLDRDGDVILTSPDITCNVDLRRQQYQAMYTGVAGQVARELIKLKTLAQIDVLRDLPSHPIVPGQLIILNGQRVTVRRKGEMIYGEYIWEAHERGLSDLSRLKDVDEIRLLEAQLAKKYWYYFIGISINWRGRDEKIVRPHWKSITDRGFSLSGGGSPRKALSPFHAILNYAYGILEAQVLAAINASGLDPACGCLHTDRIGRNSLVYDLMEPHRPQVDRLVLDLFAKTTFTRGMLVPLESGEVRLSKQFARFVVASCMLPLATITETIASFIKIYRGIVDSV
jgi:CRISP-associated protein Cas1